MSNNKKYYYLKLKDDFFNSDAMIVLESMADGYLYSNILLKLFLRSLKNEGKLMFNDRIPYNSTILSKVTRHNVGVVEKALQVFNDLGLIEILDNGAIYMLDIQNFIGRSSNEADRIRNYRLDIENERSVQMLYKCTPELELELDIELEIELDINEEKLDIVKLQNDEFNKDVIDKVINLLNETSLSRFNIKNAKSRNTINTRIKEGYTYEDFENVIVKKVKEWQNTDYEKYIRPETLFGTKFESYLNQKYYTKPNAISTLQDLYKKYEGAGE
jgi:predicted phage replisome organizer/uncharacterized phage protein (TIGR02220 family)